MQLHMRACRRGAGAGAYGLLQEKLSGSNCNAARIFRHIASNVRESIKWWVVKSDDMAPANRNE